MHPVRHLLRQVQSLHASHVATLLLPLSLYAGSVQALDHAEFEASLHVPFRASAQNEARSFTVNLAFPDAPQAQLAAWRVQLLSPQGKLLQTWYGIDALGNKTLHKKISWNGRASASQMPDGIYQVKLEALTKDSSPALLRADPATTVPQLLAASKEVERQAWPLQIGVPRALNMPRFNALPLAGRRAPQALAVNATGNLPYTVYYGNLHSQTNHSDGGGDNSSCDHAQGPQKGAYGPADAYAYAKGRGLDFLMTSEHNHLFDGNANSVNANADPAQAKARFQTGLQEAAAFNAANPNFLALYGMEWGVISNGGHLNIFGAQELFSWEYTGDKRLIGDTFVEKGDYAGLYAAMKQRGMLGQFNHPTTSGQFKIGSKDLAYNADGDQVMVLCEVVNSSAFSHVTDESDTELSSFEAACNKLLENGYHIAFSTNQDNHCANWGASAPNRTGVLLPQGTKLTQANFLDALKARRVFASMDKNSQIVFTANGHIMGERFNNSGPLSLNVNFASSTGRSVTQVAIIEGVPGSSGSTALLSDKAQVTITPKAGTHFYYAKVTQDDGKILWSAPIWVTQEGGDSDGDKQAPSVTAAVSGNSGTLSLSANASDNVGVVKVEFYVDGNLKGSSTNSPYTLSLNSTTLSNGTHSLQAKAYDAAGNVGSSSAQSFTVDNSVKDTTAPTISVTEKGSSGTIQFNANASDNVGVTRVDYYLDGSLKGSSNLAPYALQLDSTKLTNGSHSLLGRALDAAGNVGTSNAVSFTIDNPQPVKDLIVNGGFESKTTGWKTASGVITNNADEPAHGGSYKAWLNGYGTAHTDTLAQTVSLPANLLSAELSFWLKISSDETVTTVVKDKMSVQVKDSSGKVLATLATFSNLNKGSSYKKYSYDLSAYKGKSIQLYFEGVENEGKLTSFVVDDVSLLVK